jgi:hypothetical protein
LMAHGLRRRRDVELLVFAMIVALDAPVRAEEPRADAGTAAAGTGGMAAQAGNAASEGGAARPLGLAGLEVYLFEARSGAISRDDVAIEPKARHIPPALLDAPRGSAGFGPSHAALAVVVVDGWANAGKAAAVTLRATVKGKTVLAQKVKLPRPRQAAGAPAEALRIPFVLHETGCATVHLVARLHPVGKGGRATLERLLPFRCTS